MRAEHHMKTPVGSREIATLHSAAYTAVTATDTKASHKAAAPSSLYNYHTGKRICQPAICQRNRIIVGQASSTYGTWHAPRRCTLSYLPFKLDQVPPCTQQRHTAAAPTDTKASRSAGTCSTKQLITPTSAYASPPLASATGSSSTGQQHLWHLPCNQPLYP